MLSFTGLFGLLIVAAIIHNTGLDQHLAPALPILGLVLLAWGWKAMQGVRASRRERLQRSPLSCDELRVARSKLVKGRNAKSL